MTGPTPARSVGAVLDAVWPHVARWWAEPPRQPGRPHVLGVQGPQGGGKSTLAAGLVSRLTAEGRRAAAVSIDDFYLTGAEQDALAAAHPGNPALRHRGYPGTHDVGLGTAVLSALTRVESGRVAVPRYDKSARGGRGDRAPSAAWSSVETPLDVLVVEGWMLGFTPVPPEALTEHPHLVAPNALLAAYADWHAVLDDLIALEAPEPAHIVAWRVDAERARRDAGAPALSDAEARDYIEACLPAYAVWGPGLRARPPVRGHHLRVALNPDRSVARVQ